MAFQDQKIPILEQLTNFSLMTKLVKPILIWGIFKHVHNPKNFTKAFVIIFPVKVTRSVHSNFDFSSLWSYSTIKLQLAPDPHKRAWTKFREITNKVNLPRNIKRKALMKKAKVICKSVEKQYENVLSFWCLRYISTQNRHELFLKQKRSLLI